MGCVISKKSDKQGGQIKFTNNSFPCLETQQVLSSKRSVQFKINFSNIKIKNLPFNQTQVIIQLDKGLEKKLPIVGNNFNPIWKTGLSFDYESEADTLPQKRIILQVFNQAKKKLYSELSFNLWEVAIGPAHYDLFLNAQDEIKSRITFDLKMVQKIRMKITTKHINCELNEQMIEKAYNFQIRIRSHNCDYESQVSNNFYNPQFTRTPKLNSLQRDEMQLSALKNPFSFSTDDVQALKNSSATFQLDIKKQADNEIIDDNHYTPLQSNTKLQPMQQSRIPDDVNSQYAKNYMKDISLLSKGGINQIKEMQHSTSMRRIYQQKKELTWKFKVDSEDSPQIEVHFRDITFINQQFDIYVDEFVSSTFEFILWSNRNPETIDQQNQNKIIFENRKDTIIKKGISYHEKDKTEKIGVFHDSQSNHSIWSQPEMVDYKMIGNSYTSMNKFCSQDVQVLAELQSLLVQETRFEDKIWYNGVVAGTVSGEFIINNTPYLRQMIGGVQTEEGIQKTTLLYANRNNYPKINNLKLNSIININMQLDELMCKLNGKEISHRDRKKIDDQIKPIILTLKQKLENEAYQTLYKNEEELIKGQQVLIDLSKNILENADYVDESVRDYLYEVLNYLLFREEFYLTHMGFDKALIEKTEKQELGKLSKKDQQFYQQKIRISLHYQSFLYRTLRTVLNKFQQKGQNEKENEFLLNFFVIAYFRIPEFQEKIIEILKQENKKLNEFFEEDLIKTDKSQLVLANNIFLFSLKWKEDFYYFLRNENRAENHQKRLVQLLEDTDWQNIITEQKFMFLRFIGELCSHVVKKGKIFIPWQSLPGYGLLVKQFLLELKYNQSLPYPEAFHIVSNTLLCNENVLNYLVYVIYNKTKIYDGNCVFYTFDMINRWFHTLKEEGKEIPTSFNFSFFLKGIYLILEGEHVLSIAKTLQVVYNIYPQLPLEIQKELCEYTLSKFFFKFFIFWSKTVRWTFQQFMIYRIQHRYRNQYSDENRIQQQIKNYLILIFLTSDISKEFNYIKQKNNISNPKDKETLYVINNKFKYQQIYQNDLIYLKYSHLVEILIKIRKSISKTKQSTTKRNLQQQLQQNSMKIRLMNKRLVQRQRLGSSDSKHSHQPFNEISSLDISLQSFRHNTVAAQSVSVNQSLIHNPSNPEQDNISQQMARGQRKESDLDQDLFEDIELHPQHENFFPGVDSASNLNLEEILLEIEKENKEKNEKKKVDNKIKGIDLRNSICQKKSDDIVQKDKKKIVIYHRFNQFEDEKKLEIPKHLLKYIGEAMQEWQEMQVTYKKWFMNKKHQLVVQKLTPEEFNSKLINLNVPEIYLNMPKDETEGNISNEY